MLKKLIPLAVLIAGLIVFFATGAHQYVSFQAIQENREFLLQTVEAYGALAAIAFVLIYAVATAFSLPVGAILTVVGGFMFGLWTGTIVVALGATLGAVALFLAEKTAFGDVLRKKRVLG